MPKERRASGLKKIAALLISLGPEASARVLKLLPDADIELIAAEVANTSHVEPEFRAKILEEFMETHNAHSYLLEGGVGYARAMLESALGVAKSTEIMRRLSQSTALRPFAFARKIDPKQLGGAISEEHPQTIALVMAYLAPEQSSVIMSMLPPEVRADVAKRIATMERVSPEVVNELETVLSGKFSVFSQQDFFVAGGMKALVNILNRVDRASEKLIFEYLEREDPALAEEIRKRLFVFEDIILLDDSAIQRVIRDIDNRELAMALKGGGGEVTQRIFKNMSKRAADMLREDLDFLGPIRLRDVEEAQARIVAVIRKLDEAGEIVIARGGEDAIIA
ncbi:MAG: Flagellar motor switch protein FliG [Firmicutes bacterium]|nr:Flagellar motor switch protein FliG [Bacillota bacterium]